MDDRQVVLDTTSNIYNTLLETYTNQLNKLIHDKKKMSVFKIRAKKLRLKSYNYEGWLSEDEDEGKEAGE